VLHYRLAISDGVFVIARDSTIDLLMDLANGNFGIGTFPNTHTRFDVAEVAGTAEYPIVRISNLSAPAAGNTAIIGFNAYNGGGANWGIGSVQNSASSTDSKFHIMWSGGAAYNRRFTLAPVNASNPGSELLMGINTTTPAAAADVISSLPNVLHLTTFANSMPGGVTGGAIVVTKNGATANGDVWANFVANGATVGWIGSNSATTIAYNTTSDIRLKANIKATRFGIDDVMKIDVKDYNYKADKDKTAQTGFIAQQLHTVFPNAVTKGGDDVTQNPWAVDYGKVTPLLTKAIQDQQKVIETLEAKVKALETQNRQLASATADATTTQKAYAELAAQIKEMQQMLGISKIATGAKLATK
jgi:hypothetical protein